MKAIQTARTSTGTALLPALMLTGMVTIVVIMFFNMSTIQLRSSANLTASQTLTSLQDTAINIAISQIRQGSAQLEKPGNPWSNTNPYTLWISQPGAVRTFVANSGMPSKIYKLYSAREMTVDAADLTTPADRNLENDVPTDWDEYKDVFVDINEPNISNDGHLSFPIIDPRLLNGDLTPEGFDYSKNMAVSKRGVAGVIEAGTPAHQRVPMPVRWIYMLQDGSMGVLNESSGNKFEPFSGHQTPSVNNPIVSRIAFWTDDETSKVNVNTASEGIHWDTPRAITEQELEFAQSQPVRNEIQRFGGHPATTSLSTIFYPNKRLTPQSGADQLANIYDLVPRVSHRDSSGAATGIFKGLRTNENSTIPLPVEYDQDRLYASVDDLLLKPDRAQIQGIINDTSSIFGASDRREEQLKRLRFLLTAESRAPELTAAGMPRVSIWPVSYKNAPGDNKRTSFDNMSAFASTLGHDPTLPKGTVNGSPYHFRRSGAASNMDDFSNHYNPAGTDEFGYGMIHNNYLAQYLIEGSKLARSGYSKSMNDKYDSRFASHTANPYNMGTGVVSMLEYIRMTNSHDTTHSTNPITPRKAVESFAQAGDNWIGTDTLGQITAMDMGFYEKPLNEENKILKRSTNNNGKDKVYTGGVGREYTSSEVAMVIILAAEKSGRGANIKYVNQPLAEKLNLQTGQRAIQIGFLSEAFCPFQGYSMIAPSSSFNASQLLHLRVTTPDFGSRRAGTRVKSADEPLVQDIFGTEADANGNQVDKEHLQWGNLIHNVSHLQYLCQIKPKETPKSGRFTAANWWVGWGGSGGYMMYADSNFNNNGQAGSKSVGDFDVIQTQMPGMFSRNYFLVPTNATEMTISSVRNTVGAERCIEVRVGNQRDGDYGDRRHYIEIPNNMVVPIPQAPLQRAFTFSGRYMQARGTSDRFPNDAVDLIDSSDVVRTWVVRHGDYRLAYQRRKEGGNASEFDASQRIFVPHPKWDPNNPDRDPNAKNIPQIHAFTKAGGYPHSPGYAGDPDWGDPGMTVAPDFGAGPGKEAHLVPGVNYNSMYRPDFVINSESGTFRANIPNDYPYTVKPHETRDWDNGVGLAPDGAYWNKPDDGARIWGGNGGTIPPYFSPDPWDGVNINTTPENQTTAPNQLMPSAVMFGSIPSAISTGIQWTTYLFRPDITPGGHLGASGHSTSGNMAGAPPDHTLLDWFWMPVVEPYAVSEPFSTAGKINMNHRLAPFSYINRATGLHAVLKSERVMAIPTSAGDTYKNWNRRSANGDWRNEIDAKTTLVQWESKFNEGKFFMNASEICEQFLVPKGTAGGAGSASSVRAAMQSFWNSHALTGDNTMERPYANLYPRLTTKSNTFRVHYLVQTLTKARSTAPDTFDSLKDSVTGETQGDALIERSIDPNDPAFKDPSTKGFYDYINKARTPTSGGLTSTKPLDTLYTWRIRNVRKFVN